MEDRILELLIKKSSGEISLPEQAELARLLLKEPGRASDEEIISELNASALSYTDVPDDYIQRSVDRLNALTGAKESKPDNVRYRVLWKAIAIAASVLLLVSASYMLYTKLQPVKFEQPVSVIQTKKGSKSNIVLPDGSLVWINDDTKLTYTKTFGEAVREVSLEGEAYFDVIKDDKKPFIVHTKTMDVRVLGTAFNVKAYNDEESTAATLIRGSVEVILKNKNGEKIKLKPNEKLVVQNSYSQAEDMHNPVKNVPEIALITIKTDPIDSSANETQWLNNRLAFDQDELSEIAVQLERWYNVKVIIKDSALAKQKISGVFESKSLQNVIEALKFAGDFEYNITDSLIIIHK